MPPERAIPVLVAEGWHFDVLGDLANGKGKHITSSWFSYFGKELEANWEYFLPACIIEDVTDET